ncbi:SDR family oxidoreductase [Paenibacillus sophorae]|uniref:SDR family oxidoreductase n=1 Tax=Paenibacillus sophorae TaxID=1333845 RepID=UPI00158766AA|nr:SDR family oxidoreductase [Paenibacillus sophorae]
MEKAVLITGGSAGIGKALAKIVSEKYKYKVLIVGRNEEQMKDIVKECSNIDFIKADLSKADGIKKIVEAVSQRNTKLNYLVNNAAVQNLSLLKDITEEQFDESMNVNVKAPLMLVKGLMETNMFEKNTRILMVSSSSRYNIQKGMGLYSVSKEAMFTLHKVMKKEYAESLLISSVYPGTVYGTKTAKGMEASKIPEIIELRKDMKEFLSSNKSIRILSPDQAALFISWVLCNTSDEEYIKPKLARNFNDTVINEEEWDIRDCEFYINCPYKDGTKLKQLANFLGK